MKILTAQQTREADQATIQKLNITSDELMERAARAFCGWFENKFTPATPIYVFCGPGNNGGDGLAISRILTQNNYQVKTFVIQSANHSPDFELNYHRLQKLQEIREIKEEEKLPEIPEKAVVIDALFGSGLNRSVSGLFGNVIKHINQSEAPVVAVDIPSGLFSDKQTEADGEIIEANYTVSFELPKLAFLLPQHSTYTGKWSIVPIGLDPDVIEHLPASYHCITSDYIKKLITPREPFSHKGTFGHALLISGSYGKMGATVLATRACLRSGAGLVSTHIPAIGYDILQTSAPEAMVSVDKNRKYLSQLPEMKGFDVIGIGPGIGKQAQTKTMVGQLLATTQLPLVLDADALNIISENEKLKNAIPKNSILTPHPKEFERLAGKAENDYHQLELLKAFCKKHHCYLVLKGRYTCIATPEEELYFNTSGNPGMATGGTGDVLTGIITALVAQNYTPLQACQVGVFVHGLAGDLAAAAKGETALIASDLIAFLGKAFKRLTETNR